MRKRVSFVLILFLYLFFFSACGGGGSGDASVDPAGYDGQITDSSLTGAWQAEETWFDEQGDVYIRFDPYTVALIQEGQSLQIDAGTWLYLSGPLALGVWDAAGYALFAEGQCDYEVTFQVHDASRISGSGTYSLAGSSGPVEFVLYRTVDAPGGGVPPPAPDEGDPQPDDGDGSDPKKDKPDKPSRRR